MDSIDIESEDDYDDSVGSETEICENPFLPGAAENALEDLSASESESDEEEEEVSDSSDDPEPIETEKTELQLITEYAYANLSNIGYGCFLTVNSENKLQCRDCGRPWKRAPRIITHWKNFHYNKLAILVDLHKNGLWDVDRERMDRHDPMPNPYLVAEHSRRLAPTSNVIVQRINHHTEVPTDDTDDQDVDMDDTTAESDARNYFIPTRHVQYPTRLSTEGEIPPELSIKRYLLEDPWWPFASGDEFNLAAWFLEAGVKKVYVNKYFNRGLGRKLVSGSEFTSSHKLRKRLGQMMISPADEDSLHQWKSGTVSFFEGNAEHPVLFHYRHLEPVIQSFFEEPCFQEKLVFLPEKILRSDGRRQFTEMYTADWWWRMQDTLDQAKGKGRFVIPIIFGSDETHLTNFSGDKGIWPIYLSVGNLPSTFRNKPSEHCWELVAILPIAPKHSTTGKAVEEARVQFGKTIQAAISKILEPLTELYELGIKVVCSDGSYRRGHPVVGSWLADFPEYGKLFNLKKDACPVCEVPIGNLQDCLPTARSLGNDFPSRDAAIYNHYQSILEKTNDHLEMDETGAAPLDADHRKSFQEAATAIEKWFADRMSKPFRTAVWALPHADAKTLWKPDLLHTVYLGMLKHLTGWIHDFLNAHKRLGYLDWLWKNVPKYPGLVVPTKAYREVKQWQGKEMRHAGRFLLAVVDAALFSPTNEEERASFASILNCTRSLIDFHLMCQMPLHDNESLILLDKYLMDFHAAKDVFKEFTKKKVGANAGQAAVNTYYKLLFGEIPDSKDPRVKALTAAQRKDRAAIRKEGRLNACNFNLPKLHLCGHFCEVIQEFGTLLGWSTEVTETLHKLLKEYYAASGRGPDFLKHIIKKWMQNRTFAIRCMNLQAILNSKTPEYSKEWEDTVRKNLGLFSSAQEERLNSKQNRNRFEHDDTTPELPTITVVAEPITPSGSPGQNPSYVRNLIGTVKDTKESIAAMQSTRTLQSLGRTYDLEEVLPAKTLVYMKQTSQSYSIFRTEPQLLSCLETKCSLSVDVTNATHFQLHDDPDNVVLESRKIARCTGPFTYRGEQRSDAVFFLKDGLSVGFESIWRSKKDRGVLWGTHVGILRCLYTVELPPAESDVLLDPESLESWVTEKDRRDLSDKGKEHALALVEILNEDNFGDEESASKLARLSRKKKPTFTVIPIMSIVRIAHLIPIPRQLWKSTVNEERYILNNRVELETWYKFY